MATRSASVAGVRRASERRGWGELALVLSPGALPVLVVASVCWCVHLYWATSLRWDQVVAYWTGEVFPGVSLLSAGRIVSWLLVALGLFETWRALTPAGRRRADKAVVSVAGLALAVMLVIYFDEVGDYVTWVASRG